MPTAFNRNTAGLGSIIEQHKGTILSEWLNVEIRRRWAYTAAMLVVPWLRTGLAPLLQWLVVPSLACAITAQRYGRATRRSG